MKKKIILWWGRFDPEYSRNRILRKHLISLNYVIIDFKPMISKFGFLEALIRNIKKPDLVWVPCFRQRDILSASKWCKRKRVKLIIDPLISSWDKKVHEKTQILSKKKSEYLKSYESFLFNKADIVLADTNLHADLFHKILKVKQSKIFILYVGAEESLFRPSSTKNRPTKKFEILFYGSFISLHGTHTIINSSKILASQKNIKFTLLGKGPLLGECIKLSKNSTNVFFEKNINYSDLGKRIQKADVLLGIFGDSSKAANVIPNKIFQSLACGKTVITRRSHAYPKELKESISGIFFIEPNNAKDLASTILNTYQKRHQLIKSNLRARKIYDEYFSEKIIINQLKKILKLIF